MLTPFENLVLSSDDSFFSEPTLLTTQSQFKPIANNHKLFLPNCCPFLWKTNNPTGYLQSRQSLSQATESSKEFRNKVWGFSPYVLTHAPNYQQQTDVKHHSSCSWEGGGVFCGKVRKRFTFFLFFPLKMLFTSIKINLMPDWWSYYDAV